jgi:hypothetical protein
MKHKEIWKNMAELGAMITKLEDKDVVIAMYRDKANYLCKEVDQLKDTSRRKQWLLEKAEDERDDWMRKCARLQSIIDALVPATAQTLMESARSLDQEIETVAPTHEAPQWQKNEMLALADRITAIKDWLSATSERVDIIEYALKTIPALPTSTVPVETPQSNAPPKPGDACPECKREDAIRSWGFGHMGDVQCRFCKLTWPVFRAGTPIDQCPWCGSKDVRLDGLTTHCNACGRDSV